MALALVCFLVFGGLAVLMGRSAARDWQQGRREGDGADLFFAAQQGWPAAICALIAVVAPIANVTQV